MSINNNINLLIEKNKNIKPVNQTAYHNAFLLLSETRALNELISNMKPSTRAKTEDIDKTQPPPLYDSRRRSPSSRRRRSSSYPTDADTLGHGNTIYEPSVTEEQNLARHIMSEVYKNVDERRDIEGYTKLESLGDDRNLVYKSNKDNTVLYGIRGTDKFSPTDWVTDLEIGIKKYLTDKIPHATMDERFDATEKLYSKIRELYPKSKIIMGGHSLGNAAGLHVLYKNKDDSNISLYGYNGYNHPLYVGNNDPRYNPQRTAYDVVSWWDKNARTINKGDISKEFNTAATIITSIFAYQSKVISDIEKEGWKDLGKVTDAIRDMRQGRSHIGKVGDPIMGAESFGEDINTIRKSEIADWGIKWDANRAKKLALELETQNAESVLEMEALEENREQLMLDLFEIMPKGAEGEHFNELVESKIPIKETLKNLGFTDNILEPATLTQEMMDEEVEGLEYVASGQRKDLLIKIAKQASVKTGTLALLILASGVAGIAAAHATEHFEPEKNLFINKKKEEDDDYQL